MSLILVISCIPFCCPCNPDSPLVSPWLVMEPLSIHRNFNTEGKLSWAHNLVPVPSKPLHRAPDPPAARVMTRRISLGAAAPPIPINTRNTRDCIQSQNQVTNTNNQSQHVASNTESAQGRHHHIGIPEPQRDINISLCHWIATTPVVPGRHAP